MSSARIVQVSLRTTCAPASMGEPAWRTSCPRSKAGSLEPSIFGWALDVIDDENLNGSLRWFELES